MMERCDESGSWDVCLAENDTLEINRERRLEMVRRVDHDDAALLEGSLNTVWKITEGEQTKMTEESRCGDSRLSREDHVVRSTDHHQLPLDTHLMSTSVAEEGTPAVKPAADVLQNDSLFSFGASPPASLTEAEPQATGCRDYVVMDNCGKATSLDENHMDFLPLSMQKEYQKGDPVQSGESVESEQVMLHSSNDLTDAERQDRHGVIMSNQTPTTVEDKEGKMLYHSVFLQMQQQQKHKPGRKFKKKTLIKMAKLFVIAKGSESELMDVKYSNGPLAEHEPLQLNQTDDMLTSVSLVTSQRDAVQKNSKDAKNEYDKKTVLSTVPTETTLSTPASSKKRKNPSTCKKQAKEKSKFSGAAGTDCSTSTNLLDKSDTAQESLLYSRPVTASEKKGKSKIITLKEDTTIPCDNSELSRNIPAEISSIDAPKKQAFEQGKQKKGSKVGMKKRTKPKLLPQTFTEYNDVMTQDVSEGVLVSCNEPAHANTGCSSIQHTIFHGLELNAAKQEYDKNDTSELISEVASSFQDEISLVESVHSALSSRKTIRKRRRRNQTGLTDGKDEYDKETVLSTVSTDTSSSAPVSIKKRKTPSTRKKQAKDKSKFSGAAGTDCSTSTNLLDKPDTAQESPSYCRPVTASEKKGKSKIITLKEDTTIPCDNNELSRNIPAEISSVDAPKKQAFEQGKQKKGSKVGMKKRTKRKPLPQTFTEYNDVITPDVSEGLNVSCNEPRLAYTSSSMTQDTIFSGLEFNSANDKSEPSKPISEVGSSFQDEICPVISLPSAVPAQKTIRKRQRSNKTGWADGKDEYDKETVLSTVSTDTAFSGQTAVTGTLKKRKTPSTLKKQAKDKSKFSGAAGTDCSTSTNLLDKPDAAQRSVPVTASEKKGKSRITLKEDTTIPCDNSELSRNIPAEISSVDAPKKQAFKQRNKRKGSRAGVRKRTKRKPLPQTFTEYNDVVTQDVSEGVLVSCNEPPPADTGSSSIQDTILIRMDLNAAKQKHDKSEMSTLTSDVTSSFQDEISAVESVPSAVPAPKTIRKRQRNKTGWAGRKKLKQPQISAQCGSPADVEMSTFSFNSIPCNSISGNDMINRKLMDENNVKQINTEQTLTPSTKVKHSSKRKSCIPRRPELKPQKPLECSFCGRSFRHITAFTVHKRIHTGEKPYRCPTCGKRFSQLSKLNVHSAIHSERHAVCCPCCGDTFKTKDELILHFRIHMYNIQSSDMPEEEANNQRVGNCLDSSSASSHNEPFRCSICFKEFLNTETFKMRRRTHGGKPHTCSVCGKKFCKSSSLNSHKKTHWPIKPYACSVCCKSFDKLQELKRHSQMHSGATPFSCARCEKAFSSFELLRSHQIGEACSEKQDATHGNQSVIEGFLVSQSVEGQIVTPMYFKCLICKQLHRHWCQYMLHLQIHTHGKSYTCETCRQQYDQGTEIRSHCIVCCRNSGEEKACGSALTHIWKELEAPEKQVLEPHLDDQSVPPDEDQTGQMSAIPQVETGEKEVTDMQSPPPPPSPSSSILSVNNDFDISAPSLNLASDQVSRQLSRFHLQSLIRRHCSRYSCGQCGKSFSWWNKLWLHQRFHRRTVRPAFSCSQCELEFRFFGSYMDHLREHAAQTPHACPLCPDTFVNGENLSTHISECHKQCDFLKCSTCGKHFSTLRSLKKHKLLHKGASSHFCLPCDVSFSSNSALKTHLKTHMTRLNVPQPAGLVEPLSFPYHCRKCIAKFSSTDLLQAHQVCHFTAGKKAESPPESVVSCIPSREDTQPPISESSQQKRRLPASNKKHLFRYPHPDRLYVVPVVSSEPPVVISDTEEEWQEIQIPSLSSTTTASNTDRQPGASFNSSDPSISNIPQSSAVSTLRDMDEQAGTSKNHLQDHSDKSSTLPQQDKDAFQGTNDICGCDSDSAEPPLLFSKVGELEDVIHSCVICIETFTDVSKLHEHYMDHARRV